MALIKCTHCGGVVSDKAAVCPHCGKDPHPAEVTDTTVTEEAGNSKLTVCPHCGGTVSRKAQACPHCGGAMHAAAAATVATAAPAAALEKQPEVAASGGDDYGLDDDSGSSSHKGLIIGAIVVVLLLVLLMVVYFVHSSTPKNDDSVCYADTDTACVVADSSAVDTVYAEAPVESDSVSMEDALSNGGPDNYSSSEEAYGFRSDDDVRAFVAGRMYCHEDVEMRINSRGIFVNGTDISKSYPSFTRVSANLGRITASPSISITVRREDNVLVDNSNGDRYYLSEMD